MRRTFRRWLIIFMTLAFAIAIVISFVAQTNMATANADNVMEQRISDVRTRIDDYLSRAARARTIVDSQVLTAARASARIIGSDPSILDDTQQLQSLIDDLRMDEICVSDENGIIIAAIPSSGLGYDMYSSAQSRAFIGAITYPDFKYVQEFQEKGLGNGEEVKYAGVARIDQAGIVQTGVYYSHIMKTMEVVLLSDVVNGLSVGETGKIAIVSAGTVVSATESAAIGLELEDYGFDDEAVAMQDETFVDDISGIENRIRTENYKNFLIVTTLPTSEVFSSRNSTLVLLTAFIALLFVVVFFLINKLVQTLVIDGIIDVNGSLERITRGNLDEKVNVSSSDEFKALSRGINATVDALKNHIAAEAGRIDADLALAKAIQMGNLQTMFPAFPGVKEFELFADMDPAREVGGDFYDMFMPDEDHLTCVVADVSGKGIPAAMFMMEAKSYINSLALGCKHLYEVFERANDKLCANNDAQLFVTAFIMNINIHTGAYEYVNAGHNPPVVCRKDGTCTYLKCKPAFVLGGLEGISYNTMSDTLAPGDKFIAYTDGVTEALNENYELYGEDRLLAFLSDKRDNSVTEIVKILENELEEYRGSAEQADDITVLALEFRGDGALAEESCPNAPEVPEADAGLSRCHIEIEANVERLHELADSIVEWLESGGCPQKTCLNFQIAVEEVFVNIASYAYSEGTYKPGENSVELTCELDSADKHACITFVDRGVPYNPLEKEDPDINLPAEERSIGGLGVFMVKNIMDEVAYSREGDCNIFTISKGWD